MRHWLLGYELPGRTEWRLHLVIVDVPAEHKLTYDMLAAAGFEPQNGYLDGRWTGYSLFCTDGFHKLDDSGVTKGELSGALVSKLRCIMQHPDPKTVVSWDELARRAGAPVFEDGADVYKALTSQRDGAQQPAERSKKPASEAEGTANGKVVSEKVIARRKAWHNRRVAIWRAIERDARAGETGRYIYNHMRTNRDGRKPCSYETLLDIIGAGLRGELDEMID